MVSSRIILVSSENGGKRKQFIWDTSRPLRLRHPVRLILESEKSAIYMVGRGGRRSKVPFTEGQPLCLMPEAGARVTLSSTHRFELPLNNTAPVRSRSELFGIGSALLASVLTLVPIVSFLQHRSSTAPTPPRSTPSAEVSLRAVSPVTLPPEMILFRETEIETTISAPASNLPLSVGGGRVSAGKGNKMARGTGTGGGATGSRAVLNRSTRILQDALGALGGEAGSGGVASVGKRRRTRFGFAGNGSQVPRKDLPLAENGSVSGSPNSSEEVMNQLTKNYRPATSGPTGDGTSVANDSDADYNAGAGEYAAVAGQGSSLVQFSTTELSVSGGLSHLEVQSTIQSKIGEIRRCYETAARAGNPFRGKVLMNFRILGNGSLSGVSLSDAEGMAREMQSCLRKKISKWRFKAPRGGREVQVAYPVVFMTLEGEAP